MTLNRNARHHAAWNRVKFKRLPHRAMWLRVRLRQRAREVVSQGVAGCSEV